MDAIRVFVVEDHPLTRYVLRVFLRGERDIELTGECDGSGDVPSEVAVVRPDVVLVDYRLPVAKGDILTRELKRSQPDVKVLGFSLDDDIGRKAMLDAGADAFLPKTSMENTVAAIRQVARRQRAAIPGANVPGLTLSLPVRSGPSTGPSAGVLPPGRGRRRKPRRRPISSDRR